MSYTEMTDEEFFKLVHDLLEEHGELDTNDRSGKGLINIQTPSCTILIIPEPNWDDNGLIDMSVMILPMVGDHRRMSGQVLTVTTPIGVQQIQLSNRGQTKLSDLIDMPPGKYQFRFNPQASI